MKTTFFRLGFANNSSSVHSLAFSSKLNGRDKNIDNEWEFGWNNFVLGTKESKLKYMFATLKENWEMYNNFYDSLLTYDEMAKVNHDYFFKLAKNIPIFSDIVYEAEEKGMDMFVDHQSTLSIPLYRNYDKKDPNVFFNVEFFTDLTNFIVNNSFVIIGGNDNGRDEEDKNYYDPQKYNEDKYREIKQIWNSLKDKYKYYCLCEKDNNTGEYVLSYRTGGIHKVKFGELPTDNKSEFPYLVDIKVTNKCSNGCLECYADSKPDGDSSKTFFYSLSKALKKARVFEIAIGGGEVTEFLKPYRIEHPEEGGYNISYIAEIFHNDKFKVGMTTRNYNIHKEPYWDHLVDNIDSIAVSVRNPEEVKKASDIQKSFQEKCLNRQDYSRQFNVQYILGCAELDDFKKIIDVCKENYIYNITLLGPKYCGRGNNVVWYDLGTKWINIVKEATNGEYNTFNVGIDSVLAKNYKKDLIKAGVKCCYLLCEEGKSTCFIDAVKGYIRPSSFSDEGVKCNLDNITSEEFLKIFEKF